MKRSVDDDAVCDRAVVLRITVVVFAIDTVPPED